MYQVININKTETTYRNEALNTWIRSIRDYKVLSQAEEEVALKKAQDGDNDSLNTIIKSNQRFLLSAARTYSRYADEILELISEGNIGLMEAIKHYNTNYGIKFVSYSAWWIKRYMSEYYNKNTLVRHKINNSMAAFIKKTKSEYLMKNGFDMPDYALNEMAEDKFDREYRYDGLYLKRVKVFFDNDMVQDDYDGDSVIERVTCVENKAVTDLEKEDLAIIAENLIGNTCQNDIERDVITYSYGLFGKDRLSDYEIALKYKLTEEQVRYIRNKVITRMTRYVNGEKIKLNKSKLQKGNVEDRQDCSRNNGNRLHKPGRHNTRKNIQK